MSKKISWWDKLSHEQQIQYCQNRVKPERSKYCNIILKKKPSERSIFEDKLVYSDSSLTEEIKTSIISGDETKIIAVVNAKKIGPVIIGENQLNVKWQRHGAEFPENEFPNLKCTEDLVFLAADVLKNPTEIWSFAKEDRILYNFIKDYQEYRVVFASVKYLARNKAYLNTIYPTKRNRNPKPGFKKEKL